MNSRVILSLFVLLVTAISTNAVTISQWTFEVNTPADSINSSTSPNVVADIGNGTASGFHTSAATDWSTPVGNGSANSFSANTWAIGDYFQFELSTVGFESIKVSWDQTRSSTGPALFDFAYSLNGVDFIVAQDNYSVSETTWSSGSPNSNSGFSDLSLATTLANHSTVYFRLIAESAPGGTARVDNFTVSGTAVASVPDSSPGWFGFGTLFALIAVSICRGKLRTI